MKRDFSQPFTQAQESEVYVLIEDTSTSKFLVVRSFDDDEENEGAYREEFYHVPHLSLSRGGAMAQHLAKLLHSYGLILSSYREVIRGTTVNYSFVDDTPGEMKDEVCIHATAEVSHLRQTKNQQVSLVPLSELSNMPDILNAPYVVQLGIAGIPKK